MWNIRGLSGAAASTIVRNALEQHRSGWVGGFLQLLRPWLGVAGLIAAAVFLLGSILSVLGRTPEGNSSLIGVAVFNVWMLMLSAALWRTASYSTTSRP